MTTAAVLALVTYFVVFNLNNIVFFINKTARKLKGHLIEHMKMNEDVIWKQRGDGLTEPILPSEQNATPSSWRVVQYAWVLALKWLTRIIHRIWNFVKKLYQRLINKKVGQAQEDV